MFRLAKLRSPRSEHSWLNAQTLAERLEALRRPDNTRRPFDKKISNAKLASWKSLKGFHKNNQQFCDRLRIENCTEAEFNQILGTAPQYLFPKNWKPRWLQEILHIEDNADKEAFASDALLEFSERGIVAPFLPLIRHYSNRLILEAQGIQGLQEVFGRLDQLVDLFLEPYLQNFELHVRRAVVLEVNSQRVLGLLNGTTSSERFLDFVHKLNKSENRIAFLKKYPVLARYAHRSLENWVRASSEFLVHLVRDWEKVQAEFGIESSDVLVSFSSSGDTHNKGRSVATLEFKSGRKILYKPRNLEIDQQFQRYLAWCNQHGLESKLKTMTIVSYDDHGWVEFFRNESASDESEFLEFYFRLGSLLAILYSIETVDIFFENLVAFGSHPVVVDLETLFHPVLAPMPVSSASDLARNSIQSSVMSIGILPRPCLSDDGRQTFDISAIGASIDQQAPYNVVGIDNFARDDIRITSIPGWIPRVHNRPSDAETKVPSNKILEGFCSTYELLEKNRTALLSGNGPLTRFRECQRRLIVRDTTRYGGLESDAFHPDLLRDDLNRAWHWDNLWSDTVTRPVVGRFVESELNQIQENDIPHFTTKVDGDEILGADGTKLKGISHSTAWQSARSRIRHLSNEDMRRQAWFIRASLGADDGFRANPLTHQSRSDALLGACEIGDEVIKGLIRHGDTATLLSVANIHGENEASGDAFAIDVADSGLYDGTGGVALFLAYLGKESAREEYTDAARALLNNIRREQAEGRGLNEVGGFLGIGSLVYLYTHLAALWNDVDLVQDAEALVEEIALRLDDNESLDLLTGSAGCILSLLPLLAINPRSRARKVAIRCGERLIAGQPSGEPRWMSLETKRGYSHGFAGIAMALHELGRVVKEKKFVNESVDVANLENRLVRDGQWTDSHQLDGRCQVSWCHGAPGIALGRLGMRVGDNSASFQNDIEVALLETCKYFWMRSHCLCHGTLGNLEPLLVAENDPAFREFTGQLRGSFDRVLTAVIRDGWRSLLPSQTLSLGLMTGLSGAGYSLLRFHNSLRVPSVLSLRGPGDTSTVRDSLKRNRSGRTILGKIFHEI